uniref:Neurotransmitter-gated ion-channel ligand-binding domain-containing protein n=1 Tax=Meloidogyne javanica TaxID=6303 RepID=A0A915N7M0_MELJA
MSIQNISSFCLITQLIIILFVFIFLLLNQCKTEAFTAAKKRGQSRKQSSTDFGVNNWKRGQQTEISEEDDNLLIINDDPNSRLNERIRNNLATLSAYFDVHWEDAFLNWNVSEFDGITTTFVPLRWVWRPEFYLYHSIQGRTPEYDPSAMAQLHYDGQVRLFVPITSRALCPINGLEKLFFPK